MSTSLDRRPKTDDAPDPLKSGPSSVPDVYREALSLWLEWNRAYEALTAQMFDSRHDPAALQDLMDQADERRRRAVERSAELLRSAPPVSGG